MSANNFEKLAAIDVGSHIEKKNGLSYLSWAWAVDQLLRNDPAATWEYRDPERFGETMMVFCSVNAFGKTMTAQLPVMDHRNKAIANPDAFQVNTAMQRCLAKAIALHGLGLYIYAGEDIPQTVVETISPEREAELRKLAKDTGTDWNKYLAFLKVKDIKDLKAEHFDAAKKALEKKKEAA